MTNLSPAQIDHLMRLVGWTDNQQIRTGIAVAMAESGGNPDATNHNTNGSTDYGLWQINSVHASLLAGKDWRDPVANTQMAYQVWKAAGGSWTPWSTYNSGAYKAHLDQGKAGGPGGPPAVGIPNPLSGIDAIGSAFGWLSSAHNWLRIAYVIGGGACVLMGLKMLAESGALPQAVAEPITKAADATTEATKGAATAAVLA